MAELLNRVEINEKAPQEIDPKSEEATESIPEEQTQEERPDWLPEKFSNPEEMANAYSELEKKMGAGANEEEETQEVEEEQSNDNQTESTDTNEVIVDASREFFENDGSDLKRLMRILQRLVLTKELVDSYAAGQQALMQSEEGTIKSIAER